MQLRPDAMAERLATELRNWDNYAIRQMSQLAPIRPSVYNGRRRGRRDTRPPTDFRDFTDDAALCMLGMKWERGRGTVAGVKTYAYGDDHTIQSPNKCHKYTHCSAGAENVIGGAEAWPGADMPGWAFTPSLVGFVGHTHGWYVFGWCPFRL